MILSHSKVRLERIHSTVTSLYHRGGGRDRGDIIASLFGRVRVAALRDTRSGWARVG
jgi:hypothetical protein